MRRAQIDPGLAVRVISSRALRYDRPAEATDDRPDHVRAASGLAMHNGRLVVIQDDASFFAVVASDGVSAIKLPRGLDGRRRFEVGIGNKLDKLDLESCVAIDDELWAFGSGSLPIRDKICRVQHGVPRVLDAAPFYGRLREALGSGINLEGIARLRDQLWLFHRGNTGSTDLGPAILKVSLDAMRSWLDGRAALPSVEGIEGYDLGAIEGERLGFTDAVADEDRIFYLATAEASANAVDDGRVLGSQLGVITPEGVRAAPLVGVDGRPVKAEGLALDPVHFGYGWVALDPDDPAVPASLLEIELLGPW
ncbi:MAG: hypothetical protein IPQ07_13970 [Myxococcales bacterium]|nr:hypothetical protein [Myxococcales bacterium]